MSMNARWSSCVTWSGKTPGLASIKKNGVKHVHRVNAEAFSTTVLFIANNDNKLSFDSRKSNTPSVLFENYLAVYI